MNQILRVENLTKKYKNLTAVNQVSVEVNEGEIVGLIGPNGAGKTTIIQVLLSLLEPTEGKIEIFGKEFPKHREEVLAKMNFAAPSSLLPYNLTPSESLKIFSLIYGIKNYKEKVEELLKDFQLLEFRNSRSGGLSSGEQMRLALAKAFINEPKLLLLDEPTTSLDPAIANYLREKIYQRVEKLNGAVLWASHNMKEIEKMCDRVLFLLKGKIIANDKPENLRKQYGKGDLEEAFLSIVKQA